MQGEVHWASRLLGYSPAYSATGAASTWKSWSMTDLPYAEGDSLSYCFALSSFLPQVVVLVLAGLASAPSSQRLPALVLLMFMVVNVGINVGLKFLVRDPRPPHPAVGLQYSTDYGMPSDHAQFMVFFVGYLLQFGRRRRGLMVRRGDNNKTKTVKGATLSEVFFFVCCVLVVCCGRVYNYYHTVGQVLAGAVIGLVLSVVESSRVAQSVMRWICSRGIVPVMLFCTSWTEYL